MRSVGLLTALSLMAGAFDPQLARPTRSTSPTYYRARPNPHDPLASDRTAWNNAVDEKKAAKRAAKLAKKGGA